uniref:E3 ubiquitin-protein ligase RMA n=1 Tax=Davidia involucrata TaxID=16924 RepID=A0A5B7ARY9_DAVIN
MENDTRDGIIMDLDLNQEPLDPPADSVLGLGSLLNELETTHGQIEERIRQLEAVTARARLRQRWRQARNPPEISNISTDNAIETIVDRGSERVHNGEYSMAAQEITIESGKSCKTYSTHLIEKALEMDMDVKRVVSNGGGFFDCNICLDMAREPILTCCGHLFCWACFYQLPYVYSTAKECPVCKGEVTDKNITPIYGNGNNTHVSESEYGLKVPPRPPAHRIESIRQQHFYRGESHIAVAEALRRIRNAIGFMRERPQLQNLDDVSDSSNRTNISASQVSTSEVFPNTEAGGSRRLRFDQFSRFLLSERAASLYSISSALNRAERSVESNIHDRVLLRSHAQLLPVDGSDPLPRNAAVSQTVDSTAAIYSTVPLPSSSRRADVSAAVVQLENQTTNTGTEINLLLPRPSSSRRRSGISRVSDADDEVSREPRRRRLR